MPQGQIYSFRGLLKYFLYIGATVFGGPIVLVGHMRDELVDRRKWISAKEYSEGLSLSQLAPGPLAAQLAMYLGWVRNGVLGATLTGFTFILPSFVMVLIISDLYLRFGSMHWIQGLFYGIGSAVIAVMLQSSIKLVKKTAGTDPLWLSIVAINAAIVIATEQEIVWVFLLSGIVALLIKGRLSKIWKSYAGSLVLVPAWLTTGIHGPTSAHDWTQILVYFAKAGAFVFGSGLAIVPFLHGGVVQEFHWLTERQFLDAVAVAMITPGPVVITVAFIGYLVAGPFGSIAAAIGVFLPTYLFVVLPAPYYHRFAGNKEIKAFVDGVTTAAVGTIVGAAVVLGRRAIIDIPTAAIFGITLFLIYRAKMIPQPVLILLAGAGGWLFKTLSP